MKSMAKLEQDAHKAVQDLGNRMTDLTAKIGVMGPTATPGDAGHDRRKKGLHPREVHCARDP